MVKRTLRWALLVTGVVAVLAAVRRTRSDSGHPAAPLIGGDTWPPVPLNPERLG